VGLCGLFRGIRRKRMAGAYGEGVPVFFCGFIWIGVIKLNRKQKDK